MTRVCIFHHSPECDCPEPRHMYDFDGGRLFWQKELPTAQVADTVHSEVTESDSLSNLEARVQKMRALGVLEWGDIKLGPAPSEAPDNDDETQRQPTAEDERAKRLHVRRVASASSGGPVPGPRANTRST